MGKGEMPSKNDSDEDTASTEETKEEEVKPEKDEEETPKPTEEPAPKAEEKAEESEDTKKDEEELRKVIKVDSAEEGEKEQRGRRYRPNLYNNVRESTRVAIEHNRTATVREELQTTTSTSSEYSKEKFDEKEKTRYTYNPRSSDSTSTKRCLGTNL